MEPTYSAFIHLRVYDKYIVKKRKIERTYMCLDEEDIDIECFGDAMGRI